MQPVGNLSSKMTYDKQSELGLEIQKRNTKYEKSVPGDFSRAAEKVSKKCRGPPPATRKVSKKY